MSKSEDILKMWNVRECVIFTTNEVFPLDGLSRNTTIDQKIRGRYSVNSADIETSTSLKQN